MFDYFFDDKPSQPPAAPRRPHSEDLKVDYALLLP